MDEALIVEEQGLVKASSPTLEMGASLEFTLKATRKPDRCSVESARVQQL